MKKTLLIRTRYLKITLKFLLLGRKVLGKKKLFVSNLECYLSRERENKKGCKDSPYQSKKTNPLNNAHCNTEQNIIYIPIEKKKKDKNQKGQTFRERKIALCLCKSETVKGGTGQ